MKRLLQSFLLGLYNTVRASGILSTSAGNRLFEWSYHRYKGMLEAGDIRALKSFIRPGTVVIDVGANIGFFTRLFARSVSQGGKVIAIEPETTNFSRLTAMLAREGLSSTVETLQAVAAEKSGTLKLKINPQHPADHKISDEGTPVKAVSLDDLLAGNHWPPVSLIKIDVQGAEAMVLRGAGEIIRRNRPALFLEIDDEGLRALNANAEELFKMLREQGYTIHRIIKGRISSPMEIPESLALCQDGKYADFLFVHG